MMNSRRVGLCVGLLIWLLPSLACVLKSEQGPVAEMPTGQSGPPMSVTDFTPIAPPGGLDVLLNYIPAQFARENLIPFGPAIYYFDLVQMRKDLDLSLLSGADDRQAKLPLITGINTQGLLLVPDEIALTSRGAYESWGWDIADLDQVLYLPDDETSILLGRFDRTRIKNRLLENGYQKRDTGDFEILIKPGTALHFALADGIMMISSLENHAAINSLLNYRNQGGPTLESCDAVQETLATLDAPWGAVLAPSPDWKGYLETVYVEGWMFLPDDIKAVFADLVDERKNTELVWDFTVIGWREIAGSTRLQLAYHYPSARKAERDKELVERMLTETPTLQSQHRILTWADLMTLDEIEIHERVLVARASTSGRDLLLKVFERHDIWGLMPCR